ncbi:hypothetical protein [Desulfobulbus oligotrophicus]|uniref:Uncharacterized protein n=1 Tax=Desulfobulbus oligotrophicus TaxID=1909699 RepID=A0A7T5VAR6_9BACT|nr:hypothetical protein [Desulfobulbus oligotrophicus]QQG64452.1 hypothetical protein HP555_00540 [Desulfobulbus oligotrophicus]
MDSSLPVWTCQCPDIPKQRYQRSGELRRFLFLVTMLYAGCSSGSEAFFTAQGLRPSMAVFIFKQGV